LLKGQASDEIPDREAIGLGGFVDVVGRQQTRRPGHVINDRGRGPGNMFAYMARNYSRIGIEAPARRQTDDDPDRLALVKRFLGEDGVCIAGKKYRSGYCQHPGNRLPVHKFLRNGAVKASFMSLNYQKGVLLLEPPFCQQ